jgi:hypothetical protein
VPSALAVKLQTCSEIEGIIRDFESGLGVFADDGAFAFGSRRDIELGARLGALEEIDDAAAASAASTTLDISTSLLLSLLLSPW